MVDLKLSQSQGKQAAKSNQLVPPSQPHHGRYQETPNPGREASPPGERQLTPAQSLPHAYQGKGGNATGLGATHPPESLTFPPCSQSQGRNLSIDNPITDVVRKRSFSQVNNWRITLLLIQRSQNNVRASDSSILVY